MATATLPLANSQQPTANSPLWPLYATLFASAAIVVGLIWDISWHRTIGRDTFWSPPHVLEQVAALIAGLSCGWLVLRTTFGGDRPAKQSSIRVWGFYGPLGAWVCIWGTAMMIASAPFDNWWHNAYGLDVKIISPPHMVLAWGMMGIQVGAMLLAVSAQNRGAHDPRLKLIYAASAGILLTMFATVIVEDAGFGNEMRSPMFYRMTAIVIPVALIGTARASGLRWPATTVAAIYTALMLVMIWILQLVPATPLLAPIYNPVTRMVPPPFPLLLIIPAFLLDLVLPRTRAMKDWLLAPLLGVGFVVVMVGVHWYWSEFLLSPAARNWFFAVDKWDYTNRLGPWRYEYWNTVAATGFARSMGWTLLAATISSFLGLRIGRAMSRVQR
ncbi:MAG: hypothetical protein WEA80_07975 [Gemmatimonadaceae bacterium]